MTLLTRVAASVAIVALLAVAFPRDAAAATYTITGTVTASGGGPLAGVLAYAYQGGLGATCCTPVSGATTDASGVYHISVDAGTYRIRFYPNSTTYIERWYNNAPDFGSAADVSVVGNVTGIDAALVQGHKIRGKVTNSSSSNLAGIGVHAFDATKPCCDWITGTNTDTLGDYTLVVPDGTYRVLFYPGGGTYAAEWYPNVTSFAAATNVKVEGVDVALFIDAQLDDAFTISGTVSAAGGGPLANVFVGAFKATGICCEWVAGVQTDAMGAYVLPVTPGSSYKLEFFPQGGNALGAWWSGASDFASNFETATPITVTSANITGKNATLATGHTISGTVTALTGGAPLENVYVGVLRSAGFCCEWVAGTGTDSMGKYSVAVPDGSYRIQFYPGQGTYLQQYWNASTDFQSATTVTMAGADITAIDAHLVTGLTISGTVTAAAGGALIDQVFVGAYDAHFGCCTWVGGGGTDALGQYAITVPPGDYKLMFWPTSGTYLQQWLGGAADFASPAAATVHVSANVIGKDAQLATGHTIGGTVTAVTGGTPLERVWISVLKATGEWVGGGMTSSIGTYAIAVADGPYKLRFDPPSGYVPEWWDDQSDFSHAQTITVAGANVTGKNAGLATGRLITGTVTDAAGPVAGVNVQAFLVSAGCSAQSVAMGFTDSAGHYAATVAAGTYNLAFFDPDHLSEWYDDKADCANASPILVGGMDVTGKDAVLASGHLISGVVSGPSGPIAGAWVTAWQGTCPAPLTWKAGSSSDTSGHYSIRVASGTYLINTSMSGYQSEWFDDQLDCSGATPITVGTADVTGKNFVLAPTHNVTGRVTDNSGGVADALVLAQSAGSSCAPPVWIGFARTNGSGDYTLELPDGSYSIMFSDANHVSQFFNGRADCASADPVLVSGADVAGKNAVLTRTYAVTGTVTAAASGAPIAGAFVGAFSGSTFVAATTDDSGHYTVMLPNGTYTLRFDASGMATQWWIGQPTAVAADTFTVTNGVVSGSAKDAAMAP